jgi:hypothetical protein
MNNSDINGLMLAAAATERQPAVAAPQKKYGDSASIPTEQPVLDMRELLSTDAVVLDPIITLSVKPGHGNQPVPVAPG